MQQATLDFRPVSHYNLSIEESCILQHGGKMTENQFEIERKFLIRMPDTAELLRLGERTEIVQTYLLCENGSARVRKRG